MRSSTFGTVGKASKNQPEFREPCLRDHLSITTTFSCTIDTAVMPIVRPDIECWVRDRPPKFVSRATFKNLNRWHRVFNADRRESIAFWLQYRLGLRLFLLLWATEVVCCPLGLRLLRKNRARRSRSRKKACESVFGGALPLRSRSCRRVFCCPVSGAVDFLLSSSYFFWVVWNLVYQGQLVSWRASRPLFGPHGENFDFSTIVRDFVTVERYADAFASPCRVCWKFFRHLLEQQLTWCLSLACIGVVALAWMCRVTPPRYIMSDFLACGKFSPVRRKCGALR